jgi:hypothetical protein
VKVPAGQLATIAMFVAALIALALFKQRCADSVGTMFKALEPPPTVDGGRASH